MRILLAATAGFVVAWLAGRFVFSTMDFLPWPLRLALCGITAGTIAGYLARTSGWFAGFLSIIMMETASAAIYLVWAWPVNLWERFNTPIPPQVLWSTLAAIGIGTFAGWVGQKWYETAERWRSESRAPS